MENTNHHNQQGGTGNGFLLGLIVGVLLTLLFTTKRGRVILKEVLEKGTAKFSNLEQLMRETEGIDVDEEFEGDNDFTPAEPVDITEPKETKEPVAKVKEAKADQPTKKEILAEEKIEKELSEPEAPKKQEEEKPKTPHGKRWFRLKKKS